MELKIEYMALDKLKPYEKNARKHQEADLSTIKASISEFGMSDPIQKRVTYSFWYKGGA